MMSAMNNKKAHKRCCRKVVIIYWHMTCVCMYLTEKIFSSINKSWNFNAIIYWIVWVRVVKFFYALKHKKNPGFSSSRFVSLSESANTYMEITCLATFTRKLVSIIWTNKSFSCIWSYCCSITQTHIHHVLIPL